MMVASSAGGGDGERSTVGKNTESVASNVILSHANRAESTAVNHGLSKEHISFS